MGTMNEKIMKMIKNKTKQKREQHKVENGEKRMEKKEKMIKSEKRKTNIKSEMSIKFQPFFYFDHHFNTLLLP